MKSIFMLTQLMVLITIVFASSSSGGSSSGSSSSGGSSSGSSSDGSSSNNAAVVTPPPTTTTSTSTVTPAPTTTTSSTSTSTAKAPEDSSSSETVNSPATTVTSETTIGCGSSDDSSSSSSNPCNNNNEETSEPAISGSTISPEALCRCFELDLVCEPTVTEDKTCYFYQLNRVSTELYCMEIINYLILGVGDHCELPSENIEQLIVNYAPKCYDVEIDDGIQIIFDAKNSPYASNSVSNSDSASSSSDSSEDTVIITDDFVIFSICFDSTAVDGTQENGQIEFSLGSSGSSSYGSSSESSSSVSSSSYGSSSSGGTISHVTTSSGSSSGFGSGSNVFTCDVPNILPNFCVEQPTTTKTVTTTSVVTTSVMDTTSVIETTSVMETTSVTFGVCESDDALNVAFLLDESNSVDETEWDIMTHFVERIINSDVSPASYVALWEYAKIIHPTGFLQFLDFTNAAHGRNANPNIFEQAFTDNTYNTAGITDTWEAVSRVLDSFWQYRFDCTDGCDTRSDILFVITDGAPTDDPCPRITPRLNESDVDIVLIIVGGGGNGNVDWFDEVSCLDVKDNYQDIFLVPDFDSDDFNAIEARIRDKLCGGNNPAGPSRRSEEGTQWSYNGTIGLGPVPTGDANCAPNCGGGDKSIVKQEREINNTHETGIIAKHGYPLLIGIISLIVIASFVIVGCMYSKCKKNKESKMEMQIDNNVITPNSPPLKLELKDTIEIKTGDIFIE